jgi:hypothetical protein
MLPSTIAHSIAALSLFIFTGHGAKLTKVDNFGFNPTDIQMYIYVPDRLAPKPAVVMGVSINSFQHYMSCLTSVVASLRRYATNVLFNVSIRSLRG